VALGGVSRQPRPFRDLPPGPRSAARLRVQAAHRTARLVCDGTDVDPPPPVFVPRPVPSRPVRELQRGWSRRGRLSYERDAADPYRAAREAALGAAAPGDPRLLVRVDEFPYYGAFQGADEWVGTYEVFHRDALRGTPYLLSVLPAVARDPLDPAGTEERGWTGAERRLLADLSEQGVELALHGFDHRTRHARRHDELGGLSTDALAARLDRGLERLGAIGVRPRVFVPPFNRFDAGQYEVLASRFDVICGGPESVRRMGWHPTPQWRGDAVWMPAYEPLYGRAHEILPAVRRLVERRAALWVPVVLHVSWEAEDEWASLVRFVEEAGRYARPWGEFLDAVAASR